MKSLLEVSITIDPEFLDMPEGWKHNAARKGELGQYINVEAEAPNDAEHQCAEKGRLQPAQPKDTRDSDL